jgi:hypothetical protein
MSKKRTNSKANTPTHPTAYDHRRRLRGATNWSDDDLRQLPIFTGEHFAAGELYINLNLPEVGPFRATESDNPYPGYLYVAKGSVPDHLWLRLIDSWGTEMKMGNYAPQPGAFGGHNPPMKTGYGSAGEENAGEGTEKAA